MSPVSVGGSFDFESGHYSLQRIIYSKRQYGLVKYAISQQIYIGYIPTYDVGFKLCMSSLVPSFRLLPVFSPILPFKNIQIICIKYFLSMTYALMLFVSMLSPPTAFS